MDYTSIMLWVLQFIKAYKVGMTQASEPRILGELRPEILVYYDWKGNLSCFLFLNFMVAG